MHQKLLLISISLVTVLACSGCEDSTTVQVADPDTSGNEISAEAPEAPVETPEIPKAPEVSTEAPVTPDNSIEIPEIPKEYNDTPEENPLSLQDEPYYRYAWHINPDKSALTDQEYQIDKNADIHLKTAWETTRGSQVKIAIIDSGFDIHHEDLASSVIAAHDVDNNSSDVSDDDYDFSHGSACAGLIVAPINQKGIIGIAPEAQLIVIKQWSYSDADTIRGFEYAKEQGAQVINCSWGSGQVSQAVEAELKSLYDAGITVVFSSGNEHRDLDEEGYHDESEVPWVIGVSASGEDNDVTWYSNYGSQIDILAPGGDSLDSLGILTLDKMGYSGDDGQKDLVNNNYTFVTGTSFSAPIVTGVVALMYSVNPDLTPKQVREILIGTTEKVGGSELYDEDGFETYRAYGKIDADRAVAKAMKTKTIIY